MARTSTGKKTHLHYDKVYLLCVIRYTSATNISCSSQFAFDTWHRHTCIQLVKFNCSTMRTVTIIPVLWTLLVICKLSDARGLWPWHYGLQRNSMVWTKHIGHQIKLRFTPPAPVQPKPKHHHTKPKVVSPAMMWPKHTHHQMKHKAASPIFETHAYAIPKHIGTNGRNGQQIGKSAEVNHYYYLRMI